jgi:hypothetical protein
VHDAKGRWNESLDHDASSGIATTSAGDLPLSPMASGAAQVVI